ncbi:restriction endonuclease subunit S [Aeromonas cavernicola]|uniref:Restriction endonuclease subunit S n=2 Tax=Aeromonas cavernicola TaxID=1006623 RepID=A0A2H9U0M0_9GAMM|nr:restriction endonuclease subunit S [Aeromonas cavernicola]
MQDAAGKAIPAGYKQTEVGVIPEDWDVLPLASICKEIGDGIHTTPTYSLSGDYFFINGNNIKNGNVVYDENVRRVDEAEYLKHSKTLTSKTIFLSINGTIGNLARYKAERLVLGKSVAYLTIKDSGSEIFSYYALQTEKTKKFFEDGLTGSTIKNLGLSTIRNTMIPVPSYEEQTAIANVLSDSDALIDSLEQLIGKKQAIKRATMQQLLTGRTRLPACPPSPCALRPDGTPKGYKPSELGDIPEDWEVMTYGEIFTFLSTSTNSRADLSNIGEYGYIHYGDIHTKFNNALDLNEFNLPRISSHLASSSFVENGDVVMADASEDYEGIGKSVEICNVGSKKVVAGLHTFLLRDKNKYMADGYRGYLHCIPAVKNAFDRLATGMKVYGLSKNNLAVVPVPIPSQKEQTAIATILSDMDNELAALEHKLAKARALKQGMMQQLLTGNIRLPLAVPA